MNAPASRRAAQDSMRDQLIEAARREQAGERATAGRRRRRGLGLLLVGLFGAAAAAGAADLISTGEPISDPRRPRTLYSPPATDAPQLVAKAPDPEGRLPWGVSIYTARNGDACVIAGQVRGASLGLVRDGRFRPYEPGNTGACGDLRRLPIVNTSIMTGGRQARTIVFGRVRAAERTVILKTQGREYMTPAAHGGAFLFVLTGHVPPSELHPRLGSSASG